MQTAKSEKMFSMTRTKAIYVINHGIAQYFKCSLLSSINTSGIHVYSFDESLNEVTQTCEMDMYVRYWDMACGQVKMRYFGSSFIVLTLNTDILQNFYEITKDLNPAHLYQVSMDEANVNLKFYREFVQKRKDENYHSLTDIGNCGLHIILFTEAWDLKWMIHNSGWGLKKLMKGAYHQLFHDTPAHRDDYESITGSSAYPFNFCSSR